MGTINAAATMLRHFLFVSTRRAFGLRSGLAVVAAVDQAGADVGQGGAAAPASPELRAIDGSDVVFASEGAGRASSGVGSLSFMMLLL
jgi:hypothetical protein